LPTLSHTGLNSGGGGGLSVAGSTGTLADNDWGATALIARPRKTKRASCACFILDSF
jgi:hypothetical protein